MGRFEVITEDYKFLHGATAVGLPLLDRTKGAMKKTRSNLGQADAVLVRMKLPWPGNSGEQNAFVTNLDSLQRSKSMPHPQKT